MYFQSDHNHVTPLHQKKIRFNLIGFLYANLYLYKSHPTNESSYTTDLEGCSNSFYMKLTRKNNLVYQQLGPEQQLDIPILIDH